MRVKKSQKTPQPREVEEQREEGAKAEVDAELGGRAVDTGARRGRGNGRRGGERGRGRKKQTPDVTGTRRERQWKAWRWKRQR